jgi:two-component sensor histidine kinase
MGSSGKQVASGSTPEEATRDLAERWPSVSDKVEPTTREEMLLREMQHRVANSLQIVASILSLKAESVQSEEARLHLLDARGRVLSAAAVQRQLLAAEREGRVAIGPYLSELCAALAGSMVGNRRMSIVVAAAGTLESDQAVSIGLLVTELVINALKHAFPDNREGKIAVTYTTLAPSWRLSVRDDGAGASNAPSGVARHGLGTKIIEMLVQRLDARVEFNTSSVGTQVSIIHPP